MSKNDEIYGELSDGSPVTAANMEEFVDEMLSSLKGSDAVVHSRTEEEVLKQIYNERSENKNQDQPIEMSIDEFPAYFVEDWKKYIKSI